MLAVTALVVLLPASVQSQGGPWSQPAALSTCSAPGAPAIAFPDDAPQHGTGPGAIVWSSASRCPGGAGPHLSTIAAGGDVPGASSVPHTAAGRTLPLTGLLAATAAPHGRILLASAGTGAGPGAGGLLLSEGPADGPFTTPAATGGPAAAPLALTTAYLGDVALVSPGGPRGGASAIQLRVHRYYASSFLPPVSVTPSRSVAGPALAMDYRSDALAPRAGLTPTRDERSSPRPS